MKVFEGVCDGVRVGSIVKEKLKESFREATKSSPTEDLKNRLILLSVEAL